MISVNRNLQMVRLSAGYDLVVTAGFMTPWTAPLLFEAFAALSHKLSLTRAVPMLDVTGLLFANLMGSLVVVWSLWRLMRPSRSVGWYDAVARVLFSFWQLFAVAHGASFLLIGFTCVEIVFAGLQVLPVDNPQREPVRMVAERGL